MNWADYTILALVFVSALIGALRGFTREALGLGTWILAAAVAILGGKTLATTLEPHIATPIIRAGVAYGGLFLAGLLVGGIATAIVVSQVRQSRFSSADRTVGAGLGIVRGAVITGLAVMVGMSSTLHDAAWWKQSALIRPAESLAEGLRAIIPKEWLAPIDSAVTPTSAPNPSNPVPEPTAPAPAPTAV